MNLNTLKTGDLIVCRKGALSFHYIVWIGWESGTLRVAENQAGKGVQFTTLEKALAGRPIERFEKFGGAESQRHLVVPRIHSMIGKPYELFTFNCEHFGRWVSSGKKESKQINFFIATLLLIGGLMAASKIKGVRVLGIVFLILGGLGCLSQL